MPRCAASQCLLSDLGHGCQTTTAAALPSWSQQKRTVNAMPPGQPKCAPSLSIPEDFWDDAFQRHRRPVAAVHRLQPPDTTLARYIGRTSAEAPPIARFGNVGVKKARGHFQGAPSAEEALSETLLHCMRFSSSRQGRRSFSLAGRPPGRLGFPRRWRAACSAPAASQASLHGEDGHVRHALCSGGPIARCRTGMDVRQRKGSLVSAEKGQPSLRDRRFSWKPDRPRPRLPFSFSSALPESRPRHCVEKARPKGQHVCRKQQQQVHCA